MTATRRLRPHLTIARGYRPYNGGGRGAVLPEAASRYLSHPPPVRPLAASAVPPPNAIAPAAIAMDAPARLHGAQWLCRMLGRYRILNTRREPAMPLNELVLKELARK